MARRVDVGKPLPYLPHMTRSKIKIPHDAWIVVADGERALLLQNDGDDVYPNLRTDRVIEHENPPTHDQGTDRPGRYSDTPDSHRSAFQETDWHRLEEDKFLARLADLLKQGVQAGKFDKIVLVAPPTALGSLRKVLDRQVLDRVIAEVGKDLTNQPVADIEQALTG